TSPRAPASARPRPTAHLDRGGRRRGYSRRVQPVAVRILHPTPGAVVGPLERALHDAHQRNARRLAAAFEAVGASDVLVVTEGRDGRSLGARLRTMAVSPAVAGSGSGLIVLGAGSVPLANPRDLRPFVETAGSGEARALANNRYSADIVAIGRPAVLDRLPDPPGGNGLPRWLEEV